MIFKVITAVILAASLIGTCAFAHESAASTAAKKPAVAKKAKTPKPPNVEEQIQALRQELENQANQINSLKSGMAEKDAQLKQAQQAAGEAQAAATRAEAAATQQQKAVTENTGAVNTLQTAVSGLKASQGALATTVTTETTKIKAALENPTALRYKAITMTPTGFLTGDTYWRSHATGGGVATPFSVLPYEHADAYSLSESGLTGMQSRLGLVLTGKVSWGTLRAYAEGDFLGSGATSNAVESNSYFFRQRVTMGEAETNSHLAISGGQGWTLATENAKGISIAPANIANPVQIDPNFEAGFVWLRGGNIRLTKSFAKMAFAVSAENPQLQYTASLAGNTPYAVLGSAGTSTSFFNAGISSCTPATSVVNYTNQVDGATDIAVPVYKTVNSCANLANISFNQAPDMLLKAAFDPGRGHYEIFGIARFAHETIYPGETTNGNLYGGLKDIVSGAVIAPALSTAGATSDSIVLGGLGGSLRVPVVLNKLTVGAKGLFGPGVGRYGPSTLPDVTANASGALEPVHNASGLLTVEATPIPRLLTYLYYGGDYAGREDFGSAATTSLAAPTAEFCLTGTATCTTTPTAVQMAAGGSWGAHWAAPAAKPVGYGSRLLDNSTCMVNAAPGYSGSSTGYYPGASCGAQTRNVQEVTGGYWFDFYKGDRGRLRQGFQYSYVVREGWSGAGGVGAKGVENMVFTSLRYFLP